MSNIVSGKQWRFTAIGQVPPGVPEEQIVQQVISSFSCDFTVAPSIMGVNVAVEAEGTPVSPSSPGSSPLKLS